jgi:hypothetical protein
MNDKLFKFLVKSRSRTLWTPERKEGILHIGDQNAVVGK